MQTSHTARLASAIAIALAGQAYAATAVTTSSSSTGSTAAAASGGTAVTGTNSNLIRNSPAIPTPANAAPTTTTTGNTTTTTTNTVTLPNSTNVDVRNQQTQQAVAATHASGSTSALGPLATGNASVNSPTTAGTGTTSGVGATGTGASTATASGAAVGITGFPTLGGASTLGANGVVGAPLVSSGDVTTGFATSQGSTVFANGLASNDVNAGAVLAPDVTANAANAVSVDRAINQVARDRKRVGRNGQLLYSIAPRTNGVDRSSQMRDDGPSPALTGSNSTLTR